MNGKEFHWCPQHESWVRHKPEDCKGKGYRPNREDGKPAATSKARATRTEKLAKAFKALIEDDDDKDAMATSDESEEE